MPATQLLIRKAHLLFPCLFIAFTLSLDANAGGTRDETEKQRGKEGSHRSVKHEKAQDQLCGPILIREEDGTIRVQEGSKEARCFKHLATNGERGFCKKANNSYACNTEGLVGCDSTLTGGGTCRTIDKGGGICDCACK